MNLDKKSLISSLLTKKVYQSVFITILSLTLSPCIVMCKSTPQQNTQQKIKPDPENYKKLIANIKTKQIALNTKYKKLIQQKDNKAQKKLIQETRKYIEETMPKLMHCWIGTPWDFNGTSTTPGNGKIACGYYVSIILKDMGFKVNRVSLAQQASQSIIRSLLKREHLKVFKHKLNYNTFLTQFKNMPDGIYIIGLDTHVGFLLNFNNKVNFLHSGANGVINEQEANATDIKISKYRVVGNITLQDYVIKKWLLQEKIPTFKR